MANSTGYAFALPPFRPSLTLIAASRQLRGSMAVYVPVRLWVAGKYISLALKKIGFGSFIPIYNYIPYAQFQETFLCNPNQSLFEDCFHNNLLFYAD
ncbi:MAG: hypothetical protein II397_14075, partial [Treponema sp.]|nr:hypothetical protein [Treponema sp.]